MNKDTPILYTFRRCPYAMRARMALYAAQYQVRIREVLLKNKPASLLHFSAKGTVPVLVLPDGRVIDESVNIMYWALQQSDPEHWLDAALQSEVNQLIQANDTEFKILLDGYKYPERSEHQDAIYYRTEAYAYLKQYNQRLKTQSFLCGQTASLADVAIFPFIRQFYAVDRQWLEQAGLESLVKWLQFWLASDIFNHIMVKYPVWTGEDEPFLMNKT